MTLLIALVAVVSLVLLFCAYSKWMQQYWARQGVTQLEPRFILGDTFPLGRGTISVKDFFLDIYQQYKPKGLKCVGIYNTHVPELVALDSTLLKDIIIKDSSSFASHGVFYHDTNVLTSHLFNIEGQIWRERRVKLTPLFTSGKVKMMFESVAGIAPGVVDVVGKSADSNTPLPVKDVLSRFSIDVILSAMFGLKCQSLYEPDNMFRAIGKEALTPNAPKMYIENLFNRNFLGKIGYQSFSEELVVTFSKVIKETTEYREMNDSQRNDFMKLMVQLKKQTSLSNNDGSNDIKKSGSYITDSEILCESFFMFLAGHETSSSTSTFALFCLAQDPEIQEKLRTEIKDVLKKHNGKFTYDALMEMEYLDKVVRETFRIYPVVPVIPRRCTKDYKVNNTNIVIEKGTKIYIPVIGVHLDPEFYPDPLRFNPENFSIENRAKRPEVAWMPFGEGPRLCIGMRLGYLQIKVPLVALLLKYKFTLNKVMQPPFIAEAGTVVYMFKQPILLDVTRIN
uniref:Cytochrome P450 CYP6DE4 n=1 Tax=Dendroctonus ponderosae TaxID=77166 RepID=I1VJ50_DENPD|nr:unknown [Dendroctonus ponderosae]AFI45034.1 cytochrome P450 CYP6DE4 [Dendroctonus ponderosae]